MVSWRTIAKWIGDRIWQGSVARTAIYLVLHLTTTFVVAYLLTGSLEGSLGIAMIEPICNTGWYFLLDHFWASKNGPKSNSKV